MVGAINGAELYGYRNKIYRLGFFRGSIDDARIYNRMLSAQEVLDLYRSAEMITADTTVPECSISINSGDLYTKSTTVTLSLSATDDVGVTGYYLSTSSSAPLASAPGWTSVVSADYSGTVSHTLSSGDGTKTVYVWYKDAAGNVSNTASDSVILDTMITASMQARYTFEEGAGTNATDSSGNNRNGTITGATWTTGKIGGGLSFDGNDYVTIPRVNYDEISVSAWFNKIHQHQRYIWWF
ncbi:MAG: hypothetical protein HS132_07020 [Planctomycetia bacterium]|nr:hypothetical protein [Planctomycetia bacterium]